jgi:ParB-like chromosome segregation protein Spo0J
MFELAENHVPEVENEKFGWFPIDDIKPDPYQPRMNKPKEHFQSLAISIANEGLHNMIHICITDEGLLIVNGECRYTACALFLAKLVPEGDFILGHVRRRGGVMEMYCEVKSFENDEKRRVNQILDNASRKNFDPKEELEAIRDLRDAGMSIEEIANALGRSPKVIEADLPILDLPKAVIEAYDRGEMTKVVAREIATFPTAKQQKRAWTHYASRVAGSKAQLARLEVYRKAQDGEHKIVPDPTEANPEATKAARSGYRKLLKAIEKLEEQDLVNDDTHLIVSINKRNKSEIEDLGRKLAVLSRNISDGLLKLANEK